jgi:hypothetical protein
MVAMLTYLGRLLLNTRKRPVHVSFLSRAEGELKWQEGDLLSVDPQGACFAYDFGEEHVAECLPWGSIAAIRIKPAPMRNS